MRETINGADLRRMIISAAAAIEINKQALNELNVFPVPDGDTGTNMSMTINSAASDLRKTEDPDLEKASKVAASAMLRGARGNSGVILSLLFRGISKRLKGSEECDGVLWAQALQEGVDAAYKAVMKPAEGTILTVARLSAAKAADAARENNFIEFVHEAAIEEAVKALADTVNQNPVLKKAGVVDAGGKGWVVALEAMLSALQGEDVVLPENGAVTQTKQSADFSDFNTEDITFSYCTEFIISRENDHDPENLRAFLSELGDSLVLVDDDEIIKVHVHTNDPGKALTEALNYGSFVTVKIENMRLQHTEKVLSEQEVALRRCGPRGRVPESGRRSDHLRRPDHEPQHPGHSGGGEQGACRDCLCPAQQQEHHHGCPAGRRPDPQDRGGHSLQDRSSGHHRYAELCPRGKC